MQKRDLSTVTIISHLIKLREDGHDIDLRGLIDNQAYNTIIQAAAEIQVRKNDPLKPLFELLNEQFDYGQIRLALALFEETRN